MTKKTSKMPGRVQYLYNLWQQLCPWPIFQDEALQAMAAYLHEPSTQAQLDTFERQREYPRPIRDHLHTLGLGDFFAEPPATAPGLKEGAGKEAKPESRVTTVHLCALNQLTASISTSLAVTVGVNPFALLPIYMAADQAQLAWVFERVRSGAFSAMLLTEIENGSNLLRNQTRAELGTIGEDGNFVPWSAVANVNGKAAPTHYRLSGRKDLINGGGKHELLVVFARTRQGSLSDGEIGPLSARGDFSFFVVERDSSVVSPYRWQTLPVPAADIASARFDDTIIPLSQRIGREGSGFSLAQKTLAISRGGVGAFAAGLAGRAVALATHYAQERQIYGAPILQLGAIADHLLRMQALELLVSAMSLKAAAALNVYGFGAVHYAAVAKYACCILTEDLVTEGRYLHGSRALLADHPYHRLIGDAPLLATFDGTTHLVLDQIQWRLAQLSAAGQGDDPDWLDKMAAIYRTPPQSLIKVTRAHSESLLVPPVAYLQQLARLPGEVSLQPLIALSQALLALTRHCREAKIWDTDQGLRFEAGKLLAYLETLIALVELADPPRRSRLGMSPLPPTDRLGPLLHFTYGWFGGQIATTLRTLMVRSGLVEDARSKMPSRVQGAETAVLDKVERAFGGYYAEGRNLIRNNLNLLIGA